MAEQPQAYAAVGSAATGMPPLDQDGALHMFWIDAFEDATNAPGCVFLFGKVRCADGSCAGRADKCPDASSLCVDVDGGACARD